MRAGLALILVILNVVAILSILRSRITAGRKLGWTAAVVLLPFAGAAAWFAAGRSRSQAGPNVNGRIE